MPDDFGELEQEIMERVSAEERVTRLRRWFAADMACDQPASSPIQIIALELTPEQRAGLSTDGVRIPPDDRIGLVDPADGTLKMYSRTEIRAKVKPRPPGVSYDDANGYAGTFERPLRQEVVTVARSRKFSTWVVGLAASIGFVHALLYWISR